MVVKRPVVKKKKVQKTSANQQALLRPVTVSETTLGPAAIVASPERTAAFDPLLFLAKFGVGKSRQEFQDSEPVFSQGDAADAVFYIQSGKVKLTAVSAHGKEAVVAILPEGSFFGEGCLAGQLLRMATASAVERSTIIRVESWPWWANSIGNRNLPNASSPICFPGTFAWKQIWWITSSTPAKNGWLGFSC